jgi:hypothetical protein
MPGFTLIETLTYIGLFALLLSGAITGTQSLTESIERSHTNALLETEGNFLLAKITLDPLHVTRIGSALVDTKTSPFIQLSSPEVTVSEFSPSSEFYTFTLTAFTSTGQKIASTFSVSPPYLP